MSKETDNVAVSAKSCNPFKSQQKRGHEDPLKYCAWEVLKDYPQGLDISRIAKEVQERGLRDLSKMKNASSKVHTRVDCVDGGRSLFVFSQTRGPVK